ncbi:MAG: DUF4013 domain-containing protein [Methanoregula sp.]|jgi:hypothetical protein
MDVGNMVGEAFAYAKEGLWEKWSKWFLLLIATILLALPLMGYMLKILRGEKPAPEVQDWGTLFVDGIKYAIIAIIYALPLIIIMAIALTPLVLDAMAGNVTAAMASVGAFLIGMVIFIIVAILIALVEMFGMIRFARTGSMGEAFNFSAILATIGQIGWVNYIIALIVMFIVLGIVEFICMLIPYIGIILLFIIMPFMVIFEARYLCMLYDSAGTA